MSENKALDGLENVITGLGTSKAKAHYNKWVYTADNYMELDACYQSNWIARKIVDVPAQDMTREWRRIKSAYAEEIAAEEQRLGVRESIEEAISWARLYGGAGILMLTGQDLNKPLDYKKVKKGDLKRLVIFDRFEMWPSTINTTDVLAENYLQPSSYRIQGGQQEIHWSHFVKIYGDRLPRRQMVLTQGWGASVLAKCLNDIANMVTSTEGIAELLAEANIDVIQRKGLANELASDQDDLIKKRYELFSMMKSVVNMALLDGEETLERQTLNLSGVAPILELFITWISGASRMPVTKIFGTSAKGLNATGEGDMKTYYDDVSAEQSSKLTRPMRHLDEVLVRSVVGEFPDDYDYEWNPLYQPTQVEIAQAQLLTAQKNQIYLDSNIVQPHQVMRELQSSEEYQFDSDEIDAMEEASEAGLLNFEEGQNGGADE